MAPSARSVLSAACLAALGVLVAWSPSAPEADAAPTSTAYPPAPQEATGYPVSNETVVDRCSRCHVVDDEGRMSRISWLRKTPEGWQTSVRRMVALHGVRLSMEDAREIVRYLSNDQGLAPDELRPGLFEVERRLIDYDYEGDSEVEFTCIQCHSMGRVITQRRTKEEWALLLATHRALYPLVDFQAFRRSGPPSSEPGPDGNPPDPRHPMDKAVDHLARAFPLETPEWSAWAATKRSPRLVGRWALTGHEPGKGPVYGWVDITADPSDADAFTTGTTLVYAESGTRVVRTGEALVYTAYQWRGRSNRDTDTELREVMFVERDLREMSGRWFSGAYDEHGIDVTLRRVGAGAVVTGVFPPAVQRGSEAQVRVFGTGLSAPGASSAEDAAASLDFGPGVRVATVETGSDGSLVARVSVAEDAPVGARDLYAFGTTLAEALVVHDGVDRLTVAPETGMARVGGGNFPKGYQTFEAIGWNDGPDDEPETDDDLELGRVAADWSLEEYAATFGDDDVAYVGSMGQDGTFMPAIDGPNPEREGSRNNVGDVWVVATHARAEGGELRARAHLLVTVPLFLRFDPWQEVAR